MGQETSPLRDYKLLFAIFLIGPIDVGMTLPNWHLEGNPVVLTLGPVGFIMVKVIALGGLVWASRQDNITDTRIYAISLHFLILLYSVVVITNLHALLS